MIMWSPYNSFSYIFRVPLSLSLAIWWMNKIWIKKTKKKRETQTIRRQYLCLESIRSAYENERIAPQLNISQMLCGWPGWCTWRLAMYIDDGSPLSTWSMTICLQSASLEMRNTLSSGPDRPLRVHTQRIFFLFFFIGPSNRHRFDRMYYNCNDLVGFDVACACICA